MRWAPFCAFLFLLTGCHAVQIAANPLPVCATEALCPAKTAQTAKTDTSSPQPRDPSDAKDFFLLEDWF